MDELVNVAVDQAALEGHGGCTLACLEKLLEEQLPVAGFIKLTPWVKRAFWSCLLEQAPRIQFKARAGLGVSSQVRGRTANRMASTNIGNELVVIEDHSALMRRDELDAEVIFVVASQALRDSALGLYDEGLSAFKISDLQMTVLEILGKRRKRGALRTELAKMLSMESSRFHYILKLLEARSLIILNPILSGEDATLNHSVLTAIVHLRRFAPHLEPGQVFKEVKGTKQAGVYGVSDDNNKQMKRICDALAAAKDGTLVEAELKSALGFRQKTGHRSWRRMRQALEKSGHLSVFIGTLSEKSKPRKFVRLLKLWRGGGGGKEAKEDLDDDEDADTGDPISSMDMVAERGLDWQVVDVLVESGEGGMHKHKLCRQLGISMKKFKKRLDDIKQRFGIQETDEQDGKQVVKKWRVPDSLLRHHAAVSAPPHPPQGWLGAVMDAAPSGSSPSPALENTSRQAPMAALPLSLTADANKGNATVVTEAVGVGREADGQSGRGEVAALELSADMLLDAPAKDLTAGLINQPALDGMMRAEHVPEEQPMLLPPLPEGGVAAAEGMPELLPAMYNAREAVKCSITSLGVLNPDTVKAKATVLALDRLQRLVAKLDEARFILRIDLPKFFLEKEQSGGKAQTLLDRRTIMRVVDRGVAQGRMQHCAINAPASRTGDQPQRINVICKPDVKLDEDYLLVNEIRRAYKDRLKERLSSYTQPATADIDEVPVLADVTRLKAKASYIAEPEEDPAQRVMMENGFIVARMVRVRLLHMLICKIVGLAGYGEAGPHNALDQATVPSNILPEGPVLEKSDGPLFPFRNLGDQTAGPPSAVQETQMDETGKEALKNLAEDHVGMFTLHALWSAMPLDLFLQCVGSALRSPEIPSLIEANKKLGELTLEQQRTICDAHSKKRLTSLLDVLRRMDLIRPFIFSANTFYSRSERSVFVAKALVSFQEPATPEESQEESLVTREFDLRSEEDLDNYWTRLEFVSISKPAEMKRGLPGRVTPELLNTHSWNTLKLMSLNQWMQLKQRLDAEVETVDWITCRKIANELNLSYEQVMRIAQSWRARVRRDRQRVGAPELPHLPHRVRQLTPMERLERLRKQAELRQDRYHKSKLKWHHGVPSKAKNARIERPWAIEPSMLDASLGASDGEDNVLMEEDDEGGQALPSRLVMQQRAKKFRWKLAEDRALLQGYIRWHAEQGFGEHAFRTQCRPISGTKLTERQAHRRTEALRTTKETEDFMRQINELLEGVYQREAARKVVRAEDPERQRMEKIERDRARLQESRKRQREQKRRAKLQGLLGAEADKETLSDEEMKETKNPFAPSHVAKLKELPPGQLFTINCEEDRAAHERLHELIEDVLAAAPYRSSGEPSRIRGERAREGVRRQSIREQEGDRRRAGRLPPPSAETMDALVGPRPGTFRGHSGRTLEQQLQRVVTRRSQSRKQLLLSTEQRPTPPVAAAVELTKSLLWLADSPEGSAPDSATALRARFSDAQISDAFAHLRRRNFVYHGNSRKRFHLASDFRSQLQVVDLHPDLFAEAAAARRHFEAMGGSVVIRPGTEIPSGQVAELLALASAGATDFGLPPPRKAGDAADGSSQEDHVQGINQRSILPIPYNISASVSQPTCKPPDGLTGQPAAYLEGCFQPLQAPTELDASEVVQQRVIEAAEDEAARVAPDDKASLTGIWRAIQEAGGEGLTHAQTAAILAGPDSLHEDIARDEPETAGDSQASASLSAPAAPAVERCQAPASTSCRPDHLQAASAVLQILERNGLVRRVPGFGEWTFVAVQHSKCYLTDAPTRESSTAVPQNPRSEEQDTADGTVAAGTTAVLEADATADMAIDSEAASGAVGYSGRGDGHANAAEHNALAEQLGSGSPGLVLWPWLDHKGRVIESLWRTLVMRAISAVIRAPGIPEDDLVGELAALNPMSARQLLNILLKQGLLLVQTIKVAPTRGPPSFFKVKQSVDGLEVRHYFANQQHCFSGAQEVLP